MHYRASECGSSERDKIHVCRSRTVRYLLDCDAVAMELSSQGDCWVLGRFLDCCSSGKVLVVLNVSCFRMMEGLCAHDSKEYGCRSYTGSRPRLDVLKLLSPRIGEIIPTMSLSVGSLVLLPSSPALPRVHFQKVNRED